MKKRKKQKNNEIPYKERIKTMSFNCSFELSGEILIAKVKRCVWMPEMANNDINVMQIDFDFFMAVDYQDDEKPWLRYGFLKKDIEVL